MYATACKIIVWLELGVNYAVTRTLFFDVQHYCRQISTSRSSLRTTGSANVIILRDTGLTGRQATLPEDERGELLRTVHGGARHPARQTPVRDGHRGVCPTTQKVRGRGCVSIVSLPAHFELSIISIGK